jgi:hypothetical protein
MGIEQQTLLTVEGFNRQYESYLPQTTSYRAAYEATEVDFIQQYNHRRYRNYESFKQARTQWVKLRRNREDQGRQAA